MNTRSLFGLAGLMLLVLVVLLIGTGYELAFALGVISIGTQPGQGPAGGSTALVAALLAMLAGAVLSITYAFNSPRNWPITAALAPAAAGFVAARFYTFDPYYAPTMRRISDDGAVSEGWILGLVAAAVFAGVCTRFWPWLGSGLTGLILILCAFTGVFLGGGH